MLLIEFIKVGIVIIFAVNISTGGGKVLLDDILTNQNFGSISHCFIDSRYTPPNNTKFPNVTYYKVVPKLINRWKSEYELFRLSLLFENSEILCFGNLPPFFKLKGKVITYLQNALLMPRSSFPKDGFQPFLRNIYERLIWALFSKNTDEVWVQTPWMEEHLLKTTDLNIRINPINPEVCDFKKVTSQYKYIFVTGPESHKGLEVFLKELIRFRPTDLSLLLVANIPSKKQELLEIIDYCQSIWPDFKHRQNLKREEVIEAYTNSETLINTSKLESFCLPIYEAMKIGLNIKCLNRPFNNHLKKGLEKFETISELVKSL